MKLFLKTKDYALTGEEFELWYDEKNELLQTRPVPQDISRYYEDSNYISHTDSALTLSERIYQKVKKFNLKRKLKLINALGGDFQNLLDVGAGTGEFLKTAKDGGWQVSGVEPNEKARARASEKGIEMAESLSAFKQEKFQIITLWHVLEHLEDLNEEIQNLNDLLLDTGSLIIAVPNFKSFDAKYYGGYWAAYDVPRHLWHFSKTAISKIFANHGFKVSYVKPMLFDAYYVALLSERYKSGHTNFLKAFWIGLRSNLSARRSKEYSSLLYVLRKA